MKQLLFFALLAMPAGYAYGQQATMKQVRQRTTPLPAQFDNLARWSDFDLSSLAELTLDSTVLYHITDLGGTFFSTPLERTEYFYPAPDQHVIRESERAGDAWLYLSQSTLTFDELERVRLIDAERFDEESGQWQPDSRLWSYFHGTSLTLLDSFRIDAWVHESGFWVSIMTVRNKFDNEDRLTETVTTLDGAGYQLKFRDIYTYDGAGNNILIDQFLLDEGEEYHAGQWTMQYSGNLLIEEVFSTPDGFGGYIPDSRTTYAYTPFGQVMLVRNFSYDLGNDTWILYTSTDYTYDTEERPATEIYSTYVQGEMESRSRTTYQYYTGTYLGYINYDIYDFDQAMYVLNTRRVYYYEPASSVRPVKALVNKLLFAPNPASSETYVFVDQGGQMAIYDLSGRIMSQQLLNPGPNPVDLSQLPGGVYVAMMTSLGKTVATGNIIRQ